jgi:VWFA-related protein
MKIRVIVGTAFLFLPFRVVEAQAQTPLVNLNVTAVDSGGQPVTDLRTEDFQIFDNGKPRPIASFIVVPDRSRRTPAPVFILLDLFNADLAARGLSENEIVHALEPLESSDRVYLYLLTPGAMIYAVHGVPEGGPRSDSPDDRWTRNIKPALDEALRQVNRLKPAEDRYAPLRIQPTWAALAGLTSQMAQVQGPKSFVWITQGIENGYLEPGRQMHIDTLPLRLFAARLNELETVADTVQQRPNGSIAVDNTGSAGDTLHQLTALTGGHEYPSDTTGQAIAKAMSDPPRMNYRITFPPERLDGKYHKLRVTVARKGVRIQTPQSYYASILPGRN